MSPLPNGRRKFKCNICATSLPARGVADITDAFSTDSTIAETLAHFAGVGLASHPALNEGFICIEGCYKRLRAGIEFQHSLRSVLQQCMPEDDKKYGQDETESEMVERVEHQSDQASIEPVENPAKEQQNLFGRPFIAPHADYVNTHMSFNNLEYVELTGPMCCGCDFIAKTVQDLLDHTVTNHSNRNTDDSDGSYLCDVCYGTFADDSQLDSHRQWFLNTEAFICKRCSYGFTSKERLAQHMNICIVLTNDECVSYDSCNGETIATDDAMATTVREQPANEHYLTDADAETITEPESLPVQPINGYGCCFVRCDAQFKRETDLHRHVQQLHAVRQKIHQSERASERYVCDTCQSGFKSRKTLERHRNGWRLKQQNLCSYCGKGFVTPGILKEHVQQLHVATSPQFHCEQCGKSFRLKSLLKLHLVTHRQERRYGCEQCAARFHFGYQLKKHQQAVHNVTEFPYECKECNRKMPYKYQYDLHMRMHTGEKPIVCRHGCGRKFAHATHRRRHEMVAHTVEKPHRCGGCRRAYVRRRELQQHYRIFPSHVTNEEVC